MQRLARFTLVFAILFAVFIVSPAFLSQQFAPYPLMKNGDVFDLFTPLVLIPIYWILFELGRDRGPSPKEITAFLVLSAFWVEGQGMHLAANAIGHLTENLPGTDVESLTHFFDEVLGHYLWHIGLVGLSALLLYRQWTHPFTEGTYSAWLVIAAGIIHGFNYFITVVEAATTPLGVPFAVLVLLFAGIWGGAKLKQQPLLAFFLVTYLVACLFFLGWGLYWGGHLPEFSKVGIIK